MSLHSSVLDGKNVGVIGFNARPIAASLRRQGARTFVSDYWGDSDLPDVSDDCIAVLTPIPGVRQRQPLELPLQQALIDNFEFLTKNVELDYIIVGSGFDDHVDALKSIHERGLLIGSSPISMKNSRNLTIVSKMIDSKSCKVPQRQRVQSPNAFREISSELEFPYLLRPMQSGGGSGIRFIGSESDLKRFMKSKQEENDENPLVVQQYIRGKDYSCSVLSTGRKAKAVSVQSQLIGSPSAGRNCDFAYCGNYLPSGLDSKIEQEIREISEKLSVQLELMGSVGFDFIVDRFDSIWLMEINPRIQGTLEMLEIAGDISITEQHVRAAEQELIEEIPSFLPTVKMIVYSRKSGTIADLSKIPDIFDKSPAGVFVNRGDPICTTIKSSKSINDCYHRVCETASSIQSSIKSVS